MNEIVQVNNSMPPAPLKARERAGAMAAKFAAGVRDSFPIISFKGKVWRVKWQGSENMLLNGDGSPMPYLDVVYVNTSEHISKIFYEKGYKEGDMNPPDCWSVNGIAPDRASPKIQNPTCAACPQNVFGSKITDAGKKAKACQDSRRTVVMLENDLEKDGLGPTLLRIPQSSLKGLKEFMVQMAQRGYDSNTFVSRIGFDVGEAYPKMQFNYKRVLNDGEYDHALKYETDERTSRILESAVEEVTHEPEKDVLLPETNLPPVGGSPAARREAQAQVITTTSTTHAPPVAGTTGVAQANTPTPTPVQVTPQGNGTTPPQVSDVSKKLDALLGNILPKAQ